MRRRDARVGESVCLHCVTITRTSEAEESAGAIPEAKVSPNHNKEEETKHNF